MKRAVVVLMLLFCSFPLMAQRKGSTEIGGSISFHSNQDAQQRNYSDLGFDGLICYYLSRNIGIDIEPGVGISFQPDSVSIATLLMGSLRMRLFDLIPSGYRKNDVYRLDLGVSSSVFANLGVGLWSEGYSLSQKPSTTYSGPAVMAGIGTFSQFGRFSTLRVKLQFIELFPSGPVFTKRRTLVQVGVGFGLFIRS